VPVAHLGYFTESGISITLSSKFCFVSLNRELANMNGAPAAVHMGKTVKDMVPELFPRFEPYLLRDRRQCHQLVLDKVGAVIGVSFANISKRRPTMARSASATITTVAWPGLMIA
jgi:hypothetical protein